MEKIITAAILLVVSCFSSGQGRCRVKDEVTDREKRILTDSVVLGDERFGEYLPELMGKRVAVFSNQTGIVGNIVTGSKLAEDVARNGVTDANSLIPFLEPESSQQNVRNQSLQDQAQKSGTIEYGPHLVDVLIEMGIDVTVIFSPEHGFRGEADAGEAVGSGVDKKTGVEILSLYDKGKSPTGEVAMKKFDILLVDIQDVGLRYYTYYISMHHLMEACARNNKKVIVLDRPNPNGFYVDGPVLEMDHRSGVGLLPIPTVHGMTLGELALMINGEGWLEGGIKCDLKVVPCENYTHATKTALIVPPSPNLKDMRSVYLYASTCFFEGTVVSPGRGTQWPFEIYGHPQMKEYSFTFTPRSIPGAKSPLYQDELCYGKDLRSKPLEDIWKEKVNLDYLIDAYNSLRIGDSFFGGTGFFERLTGVDYVREMIEAGCSAGDISSRWQSDIEAFKTRRAPYLLYE